MDSFSATSVVILGPDAAAPTVAAPTVPGVVFARGTGKTITSVVFDSSAVAGYQSVILYADTGTNAGGQSAHGYRQYPGTTSDTGKTRTYSFVIPDSFVAIGDSFIYYIAAVDTRGNSGSYASLVSPARTLIVGGMTFRGWAGPGSSSFDRESQSFLNSQWLPDSIGRGTRSILTITETTIPAVRVRIQDLSGYADSAEIYLNNVRVAVCTTFVAGGGTSQVDFPMPLVEGANNPIRVTLFDTAPALPAVSDTVLMYVDRQRPAIDTVSRLLNLGTYATDTLRVLVRLDSQGAGARDTNPNGLFRYLLAPETQYTILGNDTRTVDFSDSALYVYTKRIYGLYSDSFYTTLSTNFLNTANGVTTVYALVEDDAGNAVASAVMDTIIVDLFAPVLSVGSHSPRGKGRPITITAGVVDTASGAATVTIVARNSGVGVDTLITMSLASGSVTNGTWTGLIDSSVVGYDTSRTVLYYVACTDAVGRATRYPASGWDTITIVDGFRMRTFLGPNNSDFANDSRELLPAGNWQAYFRGQALSLSSYAVKDTYLQPRLLVTDASGLGTHGRAYIDTTGTGTETAYTYLGETTIVGGQAVAILSLLPRAETNYVRVVMLDSNGRVAPETYAGVLFLDQVRPTYTDSAKLISGGVYALDTNRVFFNFGATGANASDTGPGGVALYKFSNLAYLPDTSSEERLYTDSLYLTLFDSMVNTSNGVATVYFQFFDQGDNNSSTASDTVIVDYFAPIVPMTNPGSRAKNRAITLSVPVNDTASGVASAVLYARHQSTTGTTYIAYPMSLASGTAQSGNWTATISDTVVGANADTTVGVEYYVTATDRVGRTGAYRSSGSPDTISIVNGISARVFGGPQGAGFATDSAEALTSGFWIDKGVTQRAVVMQETTMPIMLRVREFTGLGTAFRVYLDTTSRGLLETAYVALGETALVSSSGESVADALVTIRLVDDTNYIRVVIFDSAGLIPPDTRSAIMFRDSTPPSFASATSIVSVLSTDTRRLTLLFGASGANATDSNPNGISKVMVNDTYAAYGIEQTYADSLVYNVADTMINPANGQVVLYVRFKDGAGNYSALATDTVIVDFFSPLLSVGSHSPRPVNYAIAVSAGAVDTASGVESATLVARNSGVGVDSVIAMSLSSGTAVNGTWRGLIDTSVVGSDTTRTVLYYISCTDAVGRTSRYPSSGWDTVTLVSGLSVRPFYGPAATFATDSAELTSAGLWNAAAYTGRSYFISDTVTLAHRLLVTEGTTLGDTFGLWVDTTGLGGSYVFIAESTFVSGAASIVLNGILPQETTLVRITVVDTAGIMPSVTSTGKLFVDIVRPAAAASDSILNSGGVITDTRSVAVNLGLTGGRVADTGPQGVRYVSISDTSATAGTQYAYADSFHITIPDTMVNVVTGVATAWFRFTDYAGNVSVPVSDTILLDLYNPNILLGSGGNIGGIVQRAKSLPINVTAYMTDSGGVASATLYVRHRTDSPTYAPVAMIAPADRKAGVWTGVIPVDTVGHVADTAIGVEFYITCIDNYGRSATYKTSVAPETIWIINGVDGRVLTKQAMGSTNYLEVTGGGAVSSNNGQLTVKLVSALGDTVIIRQIRAAGGTNLYTAYRGDFAETEVTMAGPWSTGDSLSVELQDTLVALPFADTFFYTSDLAKPVISAFTLDPARTAKETTGVYLSVTMNAYERNLRLFITQNPDTSLASDTNRQYTATTIDSRAGLPLFVVTQQTGDTAVIYASAWDAAGNVADTARLEFVVDRAAPLIAIDAVANNRPFSETVTVYATITDTTYGLGLETAVLGVKGVNGTTDTYALSLVSANRYRGTIPASKISSTAGTVSLNVTARDTFLWQGNATASFTVAAPSIAIADTGLSFTTAETVFTPAATGFVRIAAVGDTVRVQNAVASYDSTVASGALDSVVFTVTLVAGSNAAVITRTSAAGDSQVYVRYFVSDSTVPLTPVVTIDSGLDISGDTPIDVRFTAVDTFGIAAWRVLGDVVESSYVFTVSNSVSPRDIRVTLTSGDTVKTVQIQVRDSAGNISAAGSDTIRLSTGLGGGIVPTSATFDTAAGETLIVVTVTSNGETVVEQGTNDSAAFIPRDPSQPSDTLRVSIDFSDTFRQGYVRFSIPDSSTMSGSDSTARISNYALGYRTVRSIVVLDSLAQQVGQDPGTFNRIRLTWTLDSALTAFKSALEVFYYDTVTRKWKPVREDSTVINMSATDSFVNYSTGDTISVVVRHFTIYGVFPAGWAAVTNLNSIVVFPNPYVPYDGIEENGTAQSGIYLGNVPAAATIEIYDIRGQLVDKVSNTGNTALVRWDARNADNQEVSSGVYLIVVRSGGQVVVKKVAVVR